MTQIAKPNQRVQQVTDLIKQKERLIQRLVPRGVDPQRLVAQFYACAQANTTLYQCRPESVLATVLQAAQLGLELGGVMGEAWPVKFRDTCQLIPGYRGYIKKAKSSGKVTSVFAACVYEDDDFEFQYGTEATLIHKTTKNGDRSDDKLIAAYCMVTYPTGSQSFQVMWLDELLQARERSPHWRTQREKSVWGQNFAEMCRKTPCRRLMKYEQLSEDLSRMAGLDEAAESGQDQGLESVFLQRDPEEMDLVTELIALRRVKELPQDQLDQVIRDALDKPSWRWPKEDEERRAFGMLDEKQLTAIKSKLAEA